MRIYTDDELKSVHSYLLTLLKEFKRICDEEQIWYTLAFGTVLGAVRHNGFIPWDGDVDVCIKLCDVERFRSVFHNRLSKDFILNDCDAMPQNTKSHDTISYVQDLEFPDIHLDIYPLIGAPNDINEQKKVWKRNFNLDKIFRSKYVDLSECLEKNRKKVFFVKMIDKLIPDSFIKTNIRKRELEFDVETSNFLTCLASPYLPVPKKVWDNVVLMKFEDTEFYVPGDYDLYLRSLYGDYMTPKKI